MILSKKLIWFLTPSFWKFEDWHQLPSKKILFTFRLRYPKASRVKWKQMDVFKWQVRYKLKGNVRWGLYTSEGTWLETLCPIPFEDIPPKIQEKYQSKYTIEIQTPLRTIFEIQCTSGFNNLKLLYDETGKVVGKMIV